VLLRPFAVELLALALLPSDTLAWSSRQPVPVVKEGNAFFLAILALDRERHATLVYYIFF
jgi:hypothetical protein